MQRGFAGWRRDVVVAVVVSAAAVAGGLSLAPARAGHCDVTDLVIVSRASVRPDGAGPEARTPASNPNALVCAVAPTSEADTRLLAPGANEIGIRYTVDAGVDHLTGEVDGLGFDHFAVSLERHVVDSTGTGDPNGIFVLYDTPEFLTIPAGPAEQGAITASIDMPDGTQLAVTFRTAGAGNSSGTEAKPPGDISGQ